MTGEQLQIYSLRARKLLEWLATFFIQLLINLAKDKNSLSIFVYMIVTQESAVNREFWCRGNSMYFELH
jgi:hypothetical protein